MNITTKTAIVIAFAFAALLLLLFGGGMGTGAMFGGGTMFSGGMMGGSMGGINWVWLPVLIVVVAGVVLFAVIFGKE